MLGQLAPEAELLDVPASAQFAGGHGLHVHVVDVEVAGPEFRFRLARRDLTVNPVDVQLAKGAVMEPVVATPAVHHRVHRHRHLERRVRIDQRHERQEAVVRDAEYADLPIGLRDILHEPIDGVPGVGRMIDGRGVQGTAEGPVHDVIALGTVFAAHVLYGADVAAFDDYLGRVVVPAQDGAEVSAVRVFGQAVRIVGGARQEDGGALGASGHKNDGV